MSFDRNTETQNALKHEIKALQAECVNTCQLIENAPPDAPLVYPEEVTEKINCYVKALQTEVHNSNTPISTDDNLLTSQFLIEIQNKTGHLDELAAYTKGAIHDLDAEIRRLKNHINIAKEAQSKPRMEMQIVQPEHVQKAKEKFQIMRNEIRGLLQSLFPQCHENIRELMGQLMSAKLDNPETHGYIPITRENYRLIELLKDLNIITTNPYNKMEVKLTYH